MMVVSSRLLRIDVCVLQAEDGIRVLVRSRGLGDVYKRQAILHAMAPQALDHCLAGHVAPDCPHGEVLQRIGTVSYTHLTLPTSDLV